MKNRRLHTHTLICLTAIMLTCHMVGAADLKQDFIEPPLKYATRPLWFWNNTAVTQQGIVNQMQEARDKCGYGGFGILPFGEKFKPTYLTEDYFRVYGVALKKAKGHSRVERATRYRGYRAPRSRGGGQSGQRGR